MNTTIIRTSTLNQFCARYRNTTQSVFMGLIQATCMGFSVFVEAMLVHVVEFVK